MEKYNFDNNFYSTFYNDIQNRNENDGFKHFNMHGKKEKRVCCENELTDTINKNLLIIETQKSFLENMEFKNNENKLNILIRTSLRPELFKTCIESVLSQNYTNYHIYICYDKIESINYLQNYETKYINITTFFIENDSNEKYKFNLYNNELMDKVEDGFILFLDDDDMFTHNYCFKIINENLTNENILIWKFMRPDKLIYPKHINNIKLGEIDTTSICFHIKYKNISKWEDKQCGDYYFYNNLFKQLKEINKLNIIKVNYIITKTIFYNKMCSSI